MRLNKLPFAHAALAAGLGLSMGSVPKRALAQPAIPSPLHFDFENGVAEWVALGESCRAAPATEAGSYHGGLAGLRFDYEVGKGKGGALM